MALKIYKASEVDVTQYFSMAVYGLPKIGKTSFAATAKDCLIINTERGMGSILKTEATIVDCNTIQDLAEIMDLLRKDEKEGKYKVVVIDTMTELSALFQNAIRGSSAIMQLQQWQVVTTKLQQFVQFLRSLNKNKIYLLQQDSDATNPDRPITIPMLSPNKFKYYLLSQVDIIAKMDTLTTEEGETKRYLTAVQTPSTVAGDRFNVLPKSFPPDFEQIKKFIFDARKKGTINERTTAGKPTAPAGSTKPTGSQGAPEPSPEKSGTPQ